LRDQVLGGLARPGARPGLAFLEAQEPGPFVLRGQTAEIGKTWSKGSTAGAGYRDLILGRATQLLGGYLGNGWGWP
jgi:hypothetical protein